MKKGGLLLDQVKSKISKVDVVSFDIFDTLLVRPYIRPVDVFLHMEKALERPGFYEERRDAERRVRVRHPELEDITFDMIYEEIDDEFKDMKQKEMDWEEMVLRANPELKQVYDYVKEQGKKIIITSDMYLPTEFITKILRKNGYDGWDKLYVSGDLRKTKGHGSLWNQLVEDQNGINAKLILHIGDNPKGNYQMPKQYGYIAELYQSPIGQYTEHDKRVLNFRNQTTGELGASILIGLFAYKYMEKKCGLISDKNYWSWLGYHYAGPLHFAYAKFIEKDSLENNINHIMFVAREGYILQKVFNRINSKIKTSYVYAQRALNLVCNLDYNPKDLNFTSYLVSYYADKDDNIKKALQNKNLLSSTDYHNFICENIELFRKKSDEIKHNYSQYINNIINDKDNISLIADMGRNFSALKLIRSFINNSVRGIFLVNVAPLLDENNNVFAYSYFQRGRAFSKRETHIFTKNWDLVEFLMGSPEHSIKEIDNEGHPVYDNSPSSYEIKRSQLYPDVVDSAISFTDDILSLFNKHDIYIGYLTLIKWLNCFIDEPQKADIDNWSDIYFFRLVNNTTPSQSFSLKFSIWSYLLHPKKTKQQIQSLFWKTPFQRWYLTHWGNYIENTPTHKLHKFWGITISSKYIISGKTVKRKFLGLIKTIKNTSKKKFYIAGIKVYEKTKRLRLEDIEKLINIKNRESIDKISLKVQRSLTVANLHQRTFGEFRNKYEGQVMALIGAGPTVKFLDPLKNAVYVGLNRAFLRNDIHFDYLFSIDKAGLDTGKEQFYDGFLNYDCIKFMGDQNMGENFQIPQHIMYKDKKIRRYKTAARFLPDKFALDIDSEPLANSCSCSLQAMQFILFTNPKKVYVYGIDCSCASGQHFTGGAVNNAARGENAKAIDAQHIADWKRLKSFVNTYYPETEIYIVNPVGLRGIFKDVYTRPYLAKHPEIDAATVEILDKEQDFTTNN